MLAHTLEVQILDDVNFTTVKGKAPGPKHFSGSIYDILAGKPVLFKGHDKWYTTHIIVKGTQVTVYMDGTLVADIDQSSETYKKLFAESKFARNKKIAPKYGKNIMGRIGLQDHKSIVWFKNAKVRKL